MYNSINKINSISAISWRVALCCIFPCFSMEQNYVLFLLHYAVFMIPIYKKGNPLESTDVTEIM